MEQLTSKELNEFPLDTLVWIMFDKANPDKHVGGPMNLDWDLALFAFLRKEDAEQMAHLIQKDFGVAQELLRDLGKASVERQIPLIVLDEANALDLFTRFPDMLDHYAGY